MTRTYRGVTIDRNTTGSVRYSALVDTPRYAGFLRADTLEGMREVIRWALDLT